MPKPVAFNYLDYKSALREIERLSLRHASDLEQIEKLKLNFETCRNELCAKCGTYKQAHLGACEGCRWEQ